MPEQPPRRADAGERGDGVTRDHIVTCDRCGTQQDLLWNGRKSWDSWDLPHGWLEIECGSEDDVCPECKDDAKDDGEQHA